MEPVLHRLKRIDRPQEGCLIVIEWKHDYYPTHAGVIVSIEPLLVTHRLERGGYFAEKETVNMYEFERGQCLYTYLYAV